MSFFRWLFSANFMPHEYCYLRNPAMIHLHFWSDLLIGMSYVAISLTLIYMVRCARRDIPFHWIFLAFGAFIIACGGTHFMEVWTLWDPLYWLSGCVKAVTAAASVATAIILPPLVPKTLEMVRAAKISDQRKADLEAANRRLEAEIAERRRAEEQIRSLAESLDIRVRERTAELARANDELAEKAAIVQHSHDAIIGARIDGAITSWNPAAEKLYGYAAPEMIGRNAALLESSGATSWDRLCERLQSGETLLPFEAQHVRKDHSTVDVLVTLSPIRDAHGALRGVSLVTRDVTERKRSEEQLRQVQKLESLGLIAGGVAHDFNNLLVGILGNASLVLDALPPSSPNHALLEQVVKASEKAAHLTAQLLAYAGKGRFVSRKVDLSALVREITPLIQTSIPKTVQIRQDLTENLPAVEADPGQLQQVVMNLVINGAEAVGDQNGVVIVTTGVQYAGAEYIRLNFAGDPIEPGQYVTLEVHDSGVGMDETVRARIFDPFFTTKFTGRGLGLSAVMGVVRAHKGTIRVYSERGKGSTFKILLPAVGGSVEPAPSADAERQLHGCGLVVVADDEEIVRTTASAALKRYGYEVITASDGADAVRKFRERASEVALVLLDMTMPVMSGEDAFREIRSIRPDIPVIVSSGYNEVEAIRRFTTKGIAGFIQKPYPAAALARAVRQALGGPGPEQS